MIVTETKFKANFEKCLKIIAKKDSFITPTGKTSAKIVKEQISAVDFLRGILRDRPSDFDINSLREERLSKYENNV